jgi:hypothetical protein
VIREIRESLEQTLRERSCGHGAQLWAAIEGQVVADLAIGRTHDAAMSTDHHHLAWCLTKPILAMAAAAAAENAGAHLETTVGGLGLAGLPDEVLATSLGNLLGQCTPFARPTLMEARLAGGSARDDLLGAVGSPAAPHLDRVGFSEWVVPAVCERILEHLDGAPAGCALARRLSGIGGVVMDGALTSATIGCYIWLDSEPGTPDPPLIHDLAATTFGESRPSFGGAVTMRGVGNWYERLRLTIRRGAPCSFLPSRAWLEEAWKYGWSAWDPVLRRESTYRAGMQVDLTDAGPATHIDAATVGHLGWCGSSWGYVDLDSGLALAVLVNGSTTQSNRFDLIRAEIDGAIRGTM